ncbi:MAG: GMC family oxidoreductase, partial [bacterium]|nr:GMC family oxidoreductase [bacterium]
KKTGVSLGRSRVAVLTKDKGHRKACDYSGRCIWGCPTNSLYVPAITLKECLTFSNFTYLPGNLVTHFDYDSGNNVTAVNTRSTSDGKTNRFPVETLVLAAGTLSSSMIFLQSLYNQTGKIEKLHGLMDNRQILVPFINLKMIGKGYNAESYQYHQLAVGFEMENREYVHGQITTLKTALMQPVLQSMPLDWKTASFLGRNLHSALGVININYCDTRRQGNFVSLKPASQSGDLSSLEIAYSPADDEKKKIGLSMKRVKKFLGMVGALVPPGQSHIRPMGASVHYSGTLPMSTEAKPRTLSPNCRSHDFDNLFIVDGTSLPYLPAKNLTFTLMANAVRVADREF